MRIAILGTRGIPANYGGFETFAEELSTHLAQRGHDVTVYGRSHYVPKTITSYKGVNIVVTPGVRHKYFDTPVNTCFSTLHLLFHRYDVVLYCNSANAFLTLLPRLKGVPVVLNVDGLEWKREKWGPLGRCVYKVSEFLSTFCPTEIVTDAVDVYRYYMQKFNRQGVYIPYGANTQREETISILEKFGLTPGQYILYVSRLEPENNALAVIRAFEQVKTDMKLVIVGDAPYASEYIETLKKTRDKRIVFTGYVFGKGYREFQSHAFAYVQATEVGGTHPALVEAMGRGNFVLANDVPEHREVLGQAGIYFSARAPETLAEQFVHFLNNPSEADEYREKAALRVQKNYTWNAITDAYEHLFYRVTRRRK